MLYNSPSNKTNCLYVLSLLVALTTNKLIITKPNQKKKKINKSIKKLTKYQKKKLKKIQKLTKGQIWKTQEINFGTIGNDT